MSHLKLSEIQKQRRVMYVNGELEAKPLPETSREQQKESSQNALAHSLSASKLVFV
jgi:hypothetical protein